MTCLSGWSWKPVKLFALHISTLSPEVNVYYGQRYAIKATFFPFVTHKVELARCCRVGDIRIRCRNVGHRQDRVVVLSHGEVYDVHELKGSRIETISRWTYYAWLSVLYNRGVPVSWLKINTQAYEVIVDETLSKFNPPP
jgi:hypothetical protein